MNLPGVNVIGFLRQASDTGRSRRRFNSVWQVRSAAYFKLVTHQASL